MFEAAAATTLAAALARAPAHAAEPGGSAGTLSLSPRPGGADQIPLLQQAIDRMEAAGGGGVDLGSGHFACLSGPLRLDPTRVTLTGAGAVLDFSRRRIAAGQDPRCVLIAPGADAPQYGHAPYRMEGIRLLGPNREGGCVGVALRAERSPLSARLAFYNIDIVGFDTGILIERGTYLTQFYSCSARDCGTCVRMPPKQGDAGENLAFLGCTLGNSGLAIDNTGRGQFVFTGCSFDYVTLWYDGSGIVNFYGCWFEKQKPASAAPLFRVRDGILFLHGGLLQVSGIDFDPTPSNAALFQLDSKYARVVLDGVTMWNARSAAGTLSSGPGRLVSRVLAGGANKQISAIPNASSRHDLFGGQGGFAGARIGVEAMVISDPSDGAAHDAHYGRLRAARAPDGTECAEITKTGGTGNALVASFLCPVRPLRIPTARFRWTAAVAGATPATRFWASLAQVQTIGRHPDGRALIGASETLALTTVTITPDQPAAEWMELTLTGLAADPHGPSDGATSEWVTHLRLDLNMTDLPTDAVLRVTDLRAYAI